jgi:Zn-dependent M28 family amino/carboxypeptidase
MTDQIRRYLIPAAFVLLVACNQAGSSSSEDGLASFNKDSLTSYIQTLSSDSFEGRRPFTHGEALTVEYLTNTFTRLGLEPGNGNSYVQDVPLVEISPVSVSPVSVQSSKGNFELQTMQDFVLWTKRTDSIVSLDKDDVVFAGFGVVAPEYNWNDYAGINVKGKVVMVMVNDPGFASGDSTMFKGKEMTYYGRWTYKFEEAARQGAKACLIVHNTEAASYPFKVVQSSNGGVKLHLDTREKPQYQLAMQGWVTEDAAKKMLQASGKDSSLFASANIRGFKPVPLDIRLSGTVRSKAIFNKSHNVIAKITGSKNPNEYVIYTAHWDHFGIGKKDEKGDSIYNGALDNASGTASIIEIARAFKSMKTKPERTVIFLAVTAEEQGLLGSAYYSTHPIYPVDKTVANINIDVINNMGKTKDMTISGAGQSELEDYLAEELKANGRYVAPELHPEAGHYFRSDHFNFAKVGVPSITAGSGIDNIEKGKDWGKKFEEEFTSKLYHQPSDQYDPTRWNLDGGIEDIKLLFLLGKKIAFGNAWPQWKEGSEFKALRKK